MAARRRVRAHGAGRTRWQDVRRILTPDDRYVFLELDPTGEYGWIEAYTGLPIVWAEQVFASRFEYDLLIGHPTLGTVSLGLTPRDGVPFPLRGVQRWGEMEVVRVNHRSLSMYEVAPMRDPYWGEARIYQRIVDYCIVRRELEVHDFPVADDELQRGVDEFRRQRGLDTPEATERWLTEHGLTLDRRPSRGTGGAGLPKPSGEP